MKSISHIGRILLITGMAVVGFSGCWTVATQLRQDGMGLVTRGWQAIDAAPETSTLDETVILERVSVRIVGSKARFAPGLHEHCAGYATSAGEIVLLGKVVRLLDGSGRIVLDQAVLGHEFMHLLNFKSPFVANPDLLPEYGY